MEEEGMMNGSVKTEKGKEKEMPRWKEEEGEAEIRARTRKTLVRVERGKTEKMNA